MTPREREHAELAWTPTCVSADGTTLGTVTRNGYLLAQRVTLTLACALFREHTVHVRTDA